MDFSLGNALYWSMTGQEAPGSCRRPPTPFFTRTAQEKLQLIRALHAFLSRPCKLCQSTSFSWNIGRLLLSPESFFPLSFSLSRTAHLLTNLRLLLAVRQVGAWCMGNKAAGVVLGPIELMKIAHGAEINMLQSACRVCVCCIATHSSAAVRSLLTPHTRPYKRTINVSSSYYDSGRVNNISAFRECRYWAQRHVSHSVCLPSGH